MLGANILAFIVGLNWCPDLIKNGSNERRWWISLLHKYWVGYKIIFCFDLYLVPWGSWDSGLDLINILSILVHSYFVAFLAQLEINLYKVSILLMFMYGLYCILLNFLILFKNLVPLWILEKWRNNDDSDVVLRHRYNYILFGHNEFPCSHFHLISFNFQQYNQAFVGWGLLFLLIGSMQLLTYWNATVKFLQSWIWKA